jgi:hypothetical protein
LDGFVARLARPSLTGRISRHIGYRKKIEFMVFDPFCEWIVFEHGKEKAPTGWLRSALA